MIDPSAQSCPHCQQPMTAATVRSAIWIGDRLTVVEDIPAYVCHACAEQLYDDDVSEALRRLAEDGFPAAEAIGEMTVPVFSLEGRIVRRAAAPSGDFYVD
jgi:YgiT-type zinc finger domain-containing protein